MMRPVAATTLCLILIGSPAAAQLVLPGAADSPPAASAEPGTKPKAHAARRAPKPVAPIATPVAASIVGRPLLLNGANGQLQFSAAGDGLQIDQLVLVGEVISDPKQQCRISVGGGAPIAAKSLGSPDGLLRFEADIPACPFDFDVLDGAVLAPDQLRACVFKEADCQASPAGLWGPAGVSIAADAKTGQQARARAEAEMTANYRMYDDRLTDRSKAEDLSRDQNRFVSDRDETCRAYAGEVTHSFCATRLTEARAAFLKARADELPPAAIVKPHTPAHRRKPPQ